LNRHPAHSSIDTAYLCPAPYERNRSQGGWDACSPDELFAWSQQMLSDARSYLRLQPAYKYISDGLDIINGDFLVTDVQSLSNVKTEATVRNTREIVAAQTNLRIIPAFKSEGEAYREQNNILNKGFMAWQNMTFADRRIRGAWQNACVGGTGYIGPRYDPNFYYRGKGDLVWDVYGPMDVLPLGLPPGLSLQGAYAVALRKKMPIHQVWRMFPLQRDAVKTNRVTTLGKGMVIAQAVKFASAVLKRFGQGARQPEEASTWDTVDVYYIYVDDDSVNETDHPLQIMGPDGQWGTSWSYMVPFVGQEIPSGKVLQGGRQEMRKARREDCLIYPNRRLILATDSVIINPAPEHQSSYRWDGRVPAAQFRADDWAWNFLGFPVTRYGQSLEKLIIELWRGLGDSMNLALNPGAFYDRSSTATAMLQTMNCRVPGLRVPIDMQLNNAANQFSPILPYQYIQGAVSPTIMEAASKILPSILKEQMGVADVSAMARARQLPSGDSTEKLLEAMGPLVKDQSRNMEEAIRLLGEMWKSDWFQFATAKRRMQMLGPEGVTEEDFDFEPGTLIPLTEDPDKKGNYIQMVQGPDGTWNKDSDSGAMMPTLSVQTFERARWHKNNFTFSVTPYSLHEFNSSSRKLFMMQALKLGFPLSWWTQAEQIFDIRNFGPCMYLDPDTGVKREARNELEKYIVQLEVQARVAQAMGGGQGGKKKGSSGRPQSFQQPPTLESKQGGSASTVRTSPKG
jgi:hypothetical protein